MAGTRTAPAFTAAATYRIITLHLVDASNDAYTVAKDVPVAAVAAAIETWAAAYAAASQASLWDISDLQGRSGNRLPSNADAGSRDSVETGINLSFRNGATRDSYTTRLVAPVPATMQGETDIPLPDSDEIAAIRAAELALTSGYAFSTAQYTARRERKNNPRVAG